MALQYSRRDSIEISGIPQTVQQKDLEGETIKILQAAKVQVHGNHADVMDIQACHRVGKKGATIVKFVNRKFARESLYCGRNLKGNKLYGANSQIFINNSFCPEYKYLNYLVRKAKKDNLVFRWKVRNGITSVQMEDGSDFIEVTHKNDLITLGITQEE